MAISAEMGAALFVAKGCIQCHQHDGIALSKPLVEFGPDLTDYDGSAAFLHSWLADPAAVKAVAQMPDLELSAAEIDQLSAFLTAVPFHHL